MTKTWKRILINSLMSAIVTMLESVGMLGRRRDRKISPPEDIPADGTVKRTSSNDFEDSTLTNDRIR